MDPDEQHLRRAAQQTMRSLTAGLASVTCREPLTSSMMSYIKQVLKAHLNGTQTSSAGNNNNQQTKLIDEAALAVTEANITHATNFVVKTACEKAVSELEKRLEEDYHVRRVPRQDAQPFQLDPFIMEMDTKVPESIRFKAGPVSDQMLRIYDDFSSLVPISIYEKIVNCWALSLKLIFL